MNPAMGLGRGRKPISRRGRKVRFAFHLAARLLLLLALLWLVGFGWFLGMVAAERPVSPMPHAGGIVVLTGGAERVHAGLALLVDGAAPRLLISGAGLGTSLRDFAPRDGIDASTLARHIRLGHRAATTRGNARETARWAARHHLGSIIVVTADYHMPRALIELQRQMPGITLIPEPVRPPAMADLDHWRTLRTVAAEFGKYLLVRCGLGGFAAHHIEKHV